LAITAPPNRKQMEVEDRHAEDCERSAMAKARWRKAWRSRRLLAEEDQQLLHLDHARSNRSEPRKYIEKQYKRTYHTPVESCQPNNILRMQRTISCVLAPVSNDSLCCAEPLYTASLHKLLLQFLSSFFFDCVSESLSRDAADLEAQRETGECLARNEKGSTPSACSRGRSVVLAASRQAIGCESCGDSVRGVSRQAIGCESCGDSVRDRRCTRVDALISSPFHLRSADVSFQVVGLHSARPSLLHHSLQLPCGMDRCLQIRE
jgi:hypothetical protein